MEQKGNPTYTQIKISPRQPAFNISGSTNIIDFDVPFGNYDLSQSSLVVNCTVNTISNDVVFQGGGDDSAVFDSCILLNDSSTALDFLTNSKKDWLIKNARCESNKLGVIDSAINHNKFKSNLNAVILNQNEQDNELTASTLQSLQTGLINRQPLNLLVCEGDVKSAVRSNELVIPLKDIFPSNVINNYQSSIHGDLSYHFESRLNQMNPANIQVQNGTFLLEYNNGTDTTNNAAYGAMDVIAVQTTGATVPQLSLTTSIRYLSLEDSPFFTEQKLTVSYVTHTVTTDDALATAIIKIKSIEQIITNDANNGKLQLTVVGTGWLDLVTTKGVKTITVTAINPTSTTLDINHIQLKLMEVSNAPMIKQPQVMTLPYYTSHSDSYSQVQHQTKNYYVPPLTKTAFIVFPNAGADKTWSTDAITSYRIIVDNVPLTESTIIYKSAKHFDLMRAGLLNAGLAYNNVGSNLKNWNHESDSSSTNVYDLTILCFPIKTVAQQQVLNLEINASANLSGQIQIVYQRIKNVTA